MKRPILIVSVPNDNPDEKVKKEMEDAIKQNDTFKDFEICIFWGCEATIYYPPNEEKK